MKSILDYLKEIRREVILYDLKVAGWIIYSIVLTLFVLGLILESVFIFQVMFDLLYGYWYLGLLLSVLAG